MKLVATVVMSPKPESRCASDPAEHLVVATQGMVQQTTGTRAGSAIGSAGVAIGLPSVP